MMSKMLSTISILSVVGLIGYEYVQTIEMHQKIAAFVIKGPRFTAQDGQELCERIRVLEHHSYGYQNAGKPSLLCNYYLIRP